MKDRVGSTLPGLAWWAAGAVALFFFWRIIGMPSPGVAGRLIPLAWLLAGLISPGRRPGSAEAACALLCLFSGFFWASSGAMLAVSMGSAVAATFPAMLESASLGARGSFLALLPVAPLILFTVPFTGDEPTNAALTESVILDGDLDISDNLRQIDRWASVYPASGDPVAGIAHQQPLFPLLLFPGLVGGIPGFRFIPLLICALAAWLISRCASVQGGDARAGGLALLLMPGMAVAGLAYPDWTAACLVAAGALAAGGRRPVVTVAVIAVALALLKMRYAPAGAGLFISVLIGRKRTSLLVTAAAVAAGVAVFLLADRLLLGGGIFWVRYGNMEFLGTLFYRTTSCWLDILTFPVNVLLDQEAGLLWRAPWLLMAFAGLPRLIRERSHTALPLLLSGILYLAGLVLWTPQEWHSMPTPCGRFFVPLLPLAACAASRAGFSKTLVWASIAASSIYIVMPGLRFNFLDGRDAFFDAFGGSLPRNAPLVFPSMVRPIAIVTAAWAAVWAAAGILAIRGKGRSALGIASAAIPAAILSTGALDGFYEAEDLGTDYRIGCSLYPEASDPRERLGWYGSSERLLRLAPSGDAVLIPIAAGEGDTTRVEIALRALSTEGEPPVLSASLGGLSSSILLETRPAGAPVWITRLKGEDWLPAPGPGSVLDTLVTVDIPDGGGPGVLILSSVGENDPDEGVFLDWIRVSRP